MTASTTGISHKMLWRLSLSLLMTLVMIALLKAGRLPNTWSYTHYLFNYDLGFVKRGLLGAGVHALGWPILLSYASFATLSVVVMLGCFGLLLMHAITLIRKDLWLALPVLVFFSSVAPAYLAHTIGYFDHWGLLLTLCVLSVRQPFCQAALAMTGSILLIFTHEAFLLTCFPVIFLTLACSRNHRPWMLLAAYGTLCVLAAWVASNLIITQELSALAFKTAQTRTITPLRADAFVVQSLSREANGLIMQKLWQTPYRWLELTNALLVTVPSCAYLVVSWVGRARDKGHLIVVLSIGAVLAPQLLHVFAWDMERFCVFSLTNAFLLLLVHRKPGRQLPSEAPSSGMLISAVLLVAINMTSEIKLFDNKTMRAFPYMSDTRRLLEGLN